MKKKGSAYYKLVLSYVLIFMIPICLGLIFYSYSYRIIKDWVKVANTNLLQTIHGTCDSEYTHYKGILMQFALDADVQEMAALNKTELRKEYYKVHLLQQEILKQYDAINITGNYCKDIFIYYENIDKIVSAQGTMALELYSELYCGTEGFSAEELREYLQKDHFYDLEDLNNEWADGSKVVLMTMEVLKETTSGSGAVIGVWMDVDSLNSKIEALSWRDALSWAVIDEEDNVIIGPKGIESLGLSYGEIEEGWEQRTDWQGEEYVLNAIPSEIMNLKYIVMTPEEIISGPAEELRNFFLVGVIACLLVGYGLMLQMLKINYNPLKGLLELFTQNDKDKRKIENEYQYLQEKTSLLLGEREDFEQEINKGKEATKQYYLIRYLTSIWEGKMTVEQKHISEKFLSGENVVCLLVLRDCPESQKADCIKEGSLRRFIVKNVLEELVEEHFVREAVVLGEKVAMIVHPGRNEDFETILREKIGYAQKFILDNFGFSFTALIGEPHEGVQGIHQSYLEACEVESYLSVLEEECISYKEILDGTVRKYYYSAELEEQIVNAMRSCNAKLAISFIKKVLDMNFRENKATPEIRKCLIYDMTATVLKTAEEMGKSMEEVIKLMELSGNMSFGRNVQLKFAKAIEYICEEPGQKEYGGSERLCLKVTEYIKQKYGDPDLNISQAALHFGVTPTYLSKVYKKHTGESLLTAINKTRISAAKELLYEGKTVVEVAEITGFRDSSTFIRAFKKYEGFTPGQIKDICKN